MLYAYRYIQGTLELLIAVNTHMPEQHHASDPENQNQGHKQQQQACGDGHDVCHCLERAEQPLGVPEDFSCFDNADNSEYSEDSEDGRIEGKDSA